MLYFDEIFKQMLSSLHVLQIYGIKALVKSYLPVKDAHLRSGFDGILEMLRNILLFGEVSKDIESRCVSFAREAAFLVLHLFSHYLLLLCFLMFGINIQFKIFLSA